MGDTIGILYATVDGQTLKICNEIKEVLTSSNHKVELFAVEKFSGNISKFDKIILASSVRYGLHQEKLIAYIEKNKDELNKVKTAFFSVNLVARKPEKNTPTTNPYVIKFFKNIDWKPNVVEVFAGKLDYKKYPFFDRIMIQFIMWMTKGPTNSNAKIEYTNWQKVKEFGEVLGKL